MNVRFPLFRSSFAVTDAGLTALCLRGASVPWPWVARRLYWLDLLPGHFNHCCSVLEEVCGRVVEDMGIEGGWRMEEQEDFIVLLDLCVEEWKSGSRYRDRRWKSGRVVADTGIEGGWRMEEQEDLTLLLDLCVCMEEWKTGKSESGCGNRDKKVDFVDGRWIEEQKHFT